MRNQRDPGSFLFAMTRAVRHWRRQLDLELHHCDLTEATCRPLVWMDRMGDGVRQKDLAYELEIEGSSLVRLLDALEKSGLIERRIENDRRAKGLFLTAAGRAMVEKVRSLTDALHNEVLSAISATDQRACMRAFAVLEQAFARHEQAETHPRLQMKPA